MSLHHQVWRKQKPEQMAKQRRLHTSQTVSILADCMQDGAGTLREQQCKSDTAILILTQTHTPTRAIEDSKRSSRTSNTSEIKPSFRCWDHQGPVSRLTWKNIVHLPPHQWNHHHQVVIRQRALLHSAFGEALGNLVTNTHFHTSTHTSADGSLDAAQSIHAWQHFTWEHRCGIVTTELQNFNVPHTCALCHSPSSSSRLAPPPVLTWLTLSSVFHFAQQVAVSPPPAHKHIRPLFKGQVHIPLDVCW